MLKACKESRHMEIDGIQFPGSSQTIHHKLPETVGAGCTHRLPGRRPYSMGARMVIPSSCAVGGLGVVR